MIIFGEDTDNSFLTDGVTAINRQHRSPDCAQRLKRVMTNGDVCRATEHRTKWSFWQYTTSDVTVSILPLLRTMIAIFLSHYASIPSGPLSVDSGSSQYCGRYPALSAAPCSRCMAVVQSRNWRSFCRQLIPSYRSLRVNVRRLPTRHILYIT